MRVFAVIVAVPLGLAGGFVAGVAWGILVPSWLIPDGVLPLALCLLGGWVAGRGTWTLIGPRARARRGWQ
jgi:hypothetical protein